MLGTVFGGQRSLEANIPEFRFTDGSKSFLPLVICIVDDSDQLHHSTLATGVVAAHKNGTTQQKDNRWYLLIATACSLIILGRNYVTTQNVALGLSYVFFTAAGLVLFERGITCAIDERHNAVPSFVSANGSLLRRVREVDSSDAAIITLRDVAGCIALACGIGAFFVESFKSDILVYRQENNNSSDAAWRYSQRLLWYIQLLTVIFAGIAQQGMFFIMVCSRLALKTIKLLTSVMFYA